MTHHHSPPQKMTLTQYQTTPLSKPSNMTTVQSKHKDNPPTLLPSFFPSSHPIVIGKVIRDDTAICPCPAHAHMRTRTHGGPVTSHLTPSLQVFALSLPLLFTSFDPPLLPPWRQRLLLRKVTRSLRNLSP